MYGPVIQKIRQGKNLSFKAVYTGVCSKTNAIKFEKGERQLAADKFANVLAHLMLSFSEFLWIKANYEPSPSLYYQYEASQSWNQNKRELFNQQIRSLEQSSVKIERLKLASFRLLKDYQNQQDLSKEELTLVTTYFSELSLWTLADLKFFANNCYVLPYDLLKQLLAEAVKVYSRYGYFKNSHEIVATVIVNSVDCMIANQDFNLANTYLDFLDNQILGEFKLMSYQLLSRYYRAKILFLFIDKKKGKQDLNQVLEIAKYLNSQLIADEIKGLLN
ncbi:hypothetical protein R4Y45_06515 [Holzapfeliella sp. He02]|uniref:HTH-type transcriptional regulator Rgg C-terminal domain-containing protein n=1 Tax=Holzapfeliella saturejae TaxID=3082953 RepID=A0ABU8SI30_9LACO